MTTFAMLWYSQNNLRIYIIYLTFGRFTNLVLLNHTTFACSTVSQKGSWQLMDVLRAHSFNLASKHNSLKLRQQTYVYNIGRHRNHFLIGVTGSDIQWNPSNQMRTPFGPSQRVLIREVFWNK